MYRDDQCAVCGASLPPDHVYCREHAAEVDDRLHRIGALLDRVLDDLPELAQLLGEVAPETWDWLADEVGDTDDWLPPLALRMQVHADQLDVDVDSEPGRVRLDVEADLMTWCATGVAAMDAARLRRVAQACAKATGADAAY
ncbi:MAG TPA: hypothetical protein VFZ70_08690 [Euzebyales bacterium]